MSSIETLPDASTSPTLARIGDVFLRYANFTLGGGSATIAVLHRELLEKRKWIGNDDFALCFALARLTPGTNLLAFCAGIGWLLHRLSGAILALLAASIPCAAIVIALTAVFDRWQDNSFVQAAIHGAVAAAVAITAKTSWTIAKPHYKNGARLRVIVIGASAFGLYVGFGVPAIQVLMLAGVVGFFLPAARP